MVTQRTGGQGNAPEHTHSARVHSHDHDHVSPHCTHHAGGPGPLEWQRPTSGHTHAHNHGALTHSHDDRQDGEERAHGTEGAWA